MNNNKQISNNRSEIYNLLRGKSAEEYDSIVTRLCEELAFHSSRGGVKIVPIMGWCIIKFSIRGEGTQHEVFREREVALKRLNKHHEDNDLPPFDSLDKTLQKVLCFESQFALNLKTTSTKAFSKI